MEKFSQQGRLLQLLKGPIALDEAVATRFAGAEGLSRPFKFVVDLLSTKAQVPPADAVGGELSVLMFGHERHPGQHTVRLAHGVIARWTEHGTVGPESRRLTHYRAELVPWLSLLSLSAKTRTYENTPVDKIVADVFDAAGFRNAAGRTRYRFLLARSPEPRPYVVQYAESDFAFVTRLLEEEGLYYRFDFHGDQHVLEISDKRGSGLPQGVVDEMPVKPIAHKAPLSGVPIIGPLAGLLGSLGRSGANKGAGEAAAAGGAVVGALLTPLGIGPIAGSLASSGISALADLVLNYLFTPAAIVPGDAVTELHRERVVHTETASARDFHLLRPADTGMDITSGPGARGEYFEFLGDLAGTPEAGVSPAAAGRRMREVEAGRELIRGATTNCALSPGTRVKIRGGVFGATPTEVHVVEVGHAAESANPLSVDESTTVKYVNEFSAIPVDTQYVPPRATPRPSVRGTQTAEVVGTGGAGAIDVDAHGRVLLMFPWDEGKGAGGRSQHRVHVAAPWAGVGWGAVQWPRVGQLVLVEFLEGDPARPIVTGRVYSRQHPFPYALPANKTQSGMKSRTLDGGDGNFNELRFEDRKGAEHVFLQAERDLRVRVKASEARTVGGARTAHVQGDDTHEVTKGDQLLHVKTGNQLFTVDAGDQVIEVAGGSRKATVSADDTTSATFIGMTASEQLEQEVGSSLIRMGTAGIHVESGTIKVEATTRIHLTVGASSITMTPSDITIAVGGSSVTVDAAGVKTAAAVIEHAAKAKNTMTGAVVTVEGQAMAALKGALTQVNGSALVKLGGAVTMAG